MIQPDEIIRSKRKTLAISIDAFGKLTVRAPIACSKERIFAFLQAKEGWILRKKAERTGAGIQLPSENLHGYALLLLGKPCKISVEKTDKVGYDSAQQRIILPEKNTKTRLVRWLKENAERILTDVTAQKAKEMGVAYTSLSIGSARGRWGSCSGKNEIRYTFRLLYAPKPVIEYVVVHELAHIRHKNHSKSFWQEVERYIPDWKIRRKWLKTHGALMEIL
ncbi:MAG: M48 family metallopeptidase [Clostridia bacterium]|nr:M48 family metallopeptidase [Clostridia bacterium]